MIYLNQVNEKNGAFSYVLGSNNFKISFWERVISSTNSLSDLYKCSYSERELFGALPKAFQKKAEFGNDLLDSSPESALLMKMEHQFTSEDGDLILFDNEGIHRGGLVRKGERQVIELQLYS
jgi:hypothetical protein